MPADLPRAAWTVWLSEVDASDMDVKTLVQTYDDAAPGACLALRDDQHELARIRQD